ncbi:MAG: hypothetical protein GWP91_18165 [Rhodobacterales bacterium]|nr:hypothetical protein [Rhodobacterales bacterium]
MSNIVTDSTERLGRGGLADASSAVREASSDDAVSPSGLDEKALDAILERFTIPEAATSSDKQVAGKPSGEKPSSKRRSAKTNAMAADAKKMGIRHGGLTHRMQKRMEGIQRAAERAPLVQERDLFGQQGENPTGFPAKGHRLKSATAERRLREAYDLGLCPKPEAGFIGPLFLVPSRFNQSLRGKGDGLSGDPMDPYAVAHVLGRVTRIVGTPSKVVSVSVCGEMGGPGWEGEGDSIRGPVGHILWGLRLDCLVYDIHPLLFVNGRMPPETETAPRVVDACEGLSIEWTGGTPNGPTIVFRHLPLVADKFGARKFIQTVEPEMVRQAAKDDRSLLVPVELCADFDSYLMNLLKEMLALSQNAEIKTGTVLILTLPASNFLEQAVREGLTAGNRWTLLDSFIAIEEHGDGMPKHAHDGRPLHPHRVLLWQKDPMEKHTYADKLALGGGPA